MAEPLADVSDFADYWRPLTDSETTAAEGLIGVASVLIRRRIPTLDAQVAAGTLDRSLVAYVVVEMIKAATEAANRPVDAKSMSETVGPFTRSITYGSASSLAFTDDLAALLAPTAVTTGIGSIRLGGSQAPSLPDWYGLPRTCWR